MKRLALLLVLLIPLQLFAQEPKDEKKDSVYVNPKNFLLEEMVFSASRWEQNIREVAGRISKITAEFVQFQNPQTAADLLGASNQVFIQKSQLGGGSPMLRGFSTNRVLLVVDGVRMNNAIFRSGNVQNVISLDANAIEEAEVVFGPGSVTYGSDAIGGVMDFHTLRVSLAKPGEKISFSGNALTRYSSANNENTGHVDINLGLKKWGFRSSITKSIYEDLRMGSRGPDEYLRPDYVVRENDQDVLKENDDAKIQVPGGYDQLNLMQKIRFKLSDKWNFNYSFHYSTTSDYARYDRLILRTEDENGLENAEWYYGPQKWMMHSLRADYFPDKGIANHIRFIAAYQVFEESRHNRSFGNPTRTNRFEKVNAFSINLDLEKEFNSNWMLYYGAEVVTNNVFSTAFRNNIETEEITQASTRYPNDSDWGSYAGYFNLKFKPNNYVLFNASARLSHIYTAATFDTEFYAFPFDNAELKNTAVNGSIGVVLTPTDKLKVYSNLSNGFRAPNVDDIGKVFDSEPGNVVVPNPNLKPEKAVNVEFGLNAELNKKFTIDAAVFYTQINNAIVRGPALFNGEDSIDFDGIYSRVLALQNSGKTYVYGVQTSVSFSPSSSWEINSSINYQRGKETDPETGKKFSPTHVAPLFGATNIIFKKDTWKLNLYANYNGEISFRRLAITERADKHLYAKDKNGNPYAPAWWTLNVKGSLQASENLTVDMGLENILDMRYRPYSSGISAPGRNVIVSVRYRL